VTRTAQLSSSEPLTAIKVPSLRRRAACMLYELVILFGVGLVPAVLSTLIERSLGSSPLETVLVQAVGFLCFGLYFVWMWRKTGQTLPMQTWRIRLVRTDGQPITQQQACMRYALSWLWVAPAVLAAFLAGWSRWEALSAVAVWAALYGAWALMLPERQFLHDVICGTRLVELQH
jgi:uncharacterized RDD family membrane protein YckC